MTEGAEHDCTLFLQNDVQRENEGVETHFHSSTRNDVTVRGPTWELAALFALIIQFISLLWLVFSLIIFVYLSFNLWQTNTNPSQMYPHGNTGFLFFVSAPHRQTVRQMFTIFCVLQVEGECRYVCTWAVCVHNKYKKFWNWSSRSSQPAAACKSFISRQIHQTPFAKTAI